VGASQIILNESMLNSEFDQLFFMEGFHKKTPLIPVNLRLYQIDVGRGYFIYIHIMIIYIEL
jgi:hypothetical protein